MPLTDRVLHSKDLEDFARRIAMNARQHLEATDRAWVYLPDFSDAVAEQALFVLKTIVLHERMQANGGRPLPADKEI